MLSRFFGRSRRAAAAAANNVTKKHIVVLGCGWGGYQFMRALDRTKYEVTCVSPRNHFLFTPLLASTTVGTLEFRSVIEPVRLLKNLRGYFQATCDKIDTTKKTITCRDVYKNKEFHVNYDYLVVGTGARVNTFNLPGVVKHAYFLKDVTDAIKIRNRVLECFERSSSQVWMPIEERRRLTRFVIVGGGPTSIEFASELHDFITQDVRKLFPDVKSEITVIEATDHILGAFDMRLSNYTMQAFKKRNIRVLTRSYVREVLPYGVILMNGEMIPCGMCVWATGLAPTPFIENTARDHMWLLEKQSRRLLLTEKLQVMRLRPEARAKALATTAAVTKPTPTPTPTPTTATTTPPPLQPLPSENAPIDFLTPEGFLKVPRSTISIAGSKPEISDKVSDMGMPAPPKFEKLAPSLQTAQQSQAYPLPIEPVPLADIHKLQDGILQPLPPKPTPPPTATKGPETQKVATQAQATAAPPLAPPPPHVIRLEPTLREDQFEVVPDVFALGDCAVPLRTSLPATGQVAAQEGKYLAKCFNRSADGKCEPKPFKYYHMGMMTYVGEYRALVQAGPMAQRGFLAWVFWRSVYLTRLVSWRNKFMVPMFWIKSLFFGRDVGKF